MWVASRGSGDESLSPYPGREYANTRVSDATSLATSSQGVQSSPSPASKTTVTPLRGPASTTSTARPETCAIFESSSVPHADVATDASSRAASARKEKVRGFEWIDSVVMGPLSVGDESNLRAATN